MNSLSQCDCENCMAYLFYNNLDCNGSKEKAYRKALRVALEKNTNSKE